MRIAMLHWGFPPIIGGVETHLTFLLPELVRLGHKVSLLTGSAPGSPNEFDFQRAKIFRTQYFDLNWLFKSGFQEVDENVKKIIHRYLEQTKPQVIHAHNMHYFSRYHAVVLNEYARQHKIPLVLTAHNTWTDKLFLDLTCGISWDKIIAISHYIKRELQAVGIPEKKIKVIHHGIDAQIFHPGRPSSKIFAKHPVLKGKKKVIFSPARIGLAKGCDVVIEAFRLVKKKFPEAFLLMSGSGNIIDWGLTQNKDLAFFVSLIKHFGLEESVYINTFSLTKEMPELYRLAEVVVYPSLSEEPFGLAMLEAMASAKPIIVSDAGGMPEIIKDGFNGFVIPRRNHEILAEKIINLLSDENLRIKLGKAGRAKVEQKYTKEIYAQNVLKLYEDAIKKYSLKPMKIKEETAVLREEELKLRV